MKRILAVMSINPDYVEFAIPELKSVLSQLPIPFETLFKQQLTIQPKNSYQITHETLKNFPYVTLNVPDYQKHASFFEKACKQTVMLHKFILLISKGQSYEQLVKNRDQQILVQKCRNWQDTVACDFTSRNRVLGRTYQIQKINKLLADMDIRGKIDITKAKKRYQLVEDHTWYQDHHQSPVQSTLKTVYFGVEICTNKIGTTKFNTVYELSKRIYLGPTSADNDLAFMMCNQANIQVGSFVLDPFVGTGGLIIPPASKGAYVFGCDLDMRVLNGYSVGRINKRSPYYSEQKKFQVFTPKINLNFQQYGLDTPNIFRMDSTNLGFKSEEMFDAIITDPPYGLRAMSRSVTAIKKQQKPAQTSNQTQKQNNLKQVKQQTQTQQVKGQNGEQLTGTKEVENLPKQQEPKSQIENEKQTQPTLKQSSQLTQQQKKQISKRKQKRQLKKQNRDIKKSLQSQQQKTFKKQINQKLNRQRIDQWDKFDKTKVECTQRQKIFERLIDFAQTNLKQGGRLVFLYPIFQDEEYKRADSLPNHQGFKIIDMSQNKLSKNNSRILVTLEKQVKNKEI